MQIYHLKSGINKTEEQQSYHQLRNVPPEKWYIISARTDAPDLTNKPDMSRR